MSDMVYTIVYTWCGTKVRGPIRQLEHNDGEEEVQFIAIVALPRPVSALVGH